MVGLDLTLKNARDYVDDDKQGWLKERPNSKQANKKTRKKLARIDFLLISRKLAHVWT